MIPTAPDMPEAVWLLLAKLVGAVAGSAISIVYVLPGGPREAFIRFIVGLGIGIVFGSATGHAMADYLGIAERLSRVEITLSGSTAASLCAWWGLGMLARFAKKLNS
ncbi:MAG: DUF6107 family protein [Pseudomonadota bacterium]